MSARKPDPVVSAWDRLQLALKVHCRTYDKRDEAEAKARSAGFKPGRPCIRVGDYGCMSMAEVRRVVRGWPKDTATKALEAMRTALAARQQQRRKAGLVPFVAAERHAERCLLYTS